MRRATARPYAWPVDPAQTDEHAGHEATHAAPQRQPEPPEQTHATWSPAQQLASEMGNRAFGSMIMRMRDGEGILPGGMVHPQVEAAIAGRRGGGTPLDHGVASALSPAVGASLEGVRVHTDTGAAALARAVQARAFTVGNDIYFARGEYRPGTSDGNQLIAHEVAHTIQQRGAPASGPLTVSQPGDALEREADAVARHAVA